MKTKILISLIILVVSYNTYATKWTVVSSGFTFSPATLTITQGDSVVFSLASIHDVLEVSLTTWTANGATGLAGGFSAPFAGGLVLPAKLTSGTHYYVCEPHASMGMKGKIIVNLATGIENESPKFSFTIYPNPTHDLLYVTANTELSGQPYRIYDLQGHKVLDGTLTEGTTSIDISRFAEGFYLFQFGDVKKNTIKFIKN
ncbi:MAG: T9SS type A sorting domain-containing protein [Bacteroidota bacterium]